MMKLCGCGKHKIDETGDVYAQHRDHVEYDAPASAREWSNNALRHVPGIGVSAPEAEPLALDDPTGDDVARDAYRTTGGRTLDDVIDGCRTPKLYSGGAVVWKRMDWPMGERRDPLPVHAHTSDTADALSRTVEVVHTRGVFIGRWASERARKVNGCPVIRPDTPVAINKHGEAVLVGDPSAVTGPVGVALEAPRPGVGYSFKLMPATSGPERMVSEAIARRAKVVLFQQIQEMFTSGLIEESEAIAWARGALGGEALPPTFDTLDRPQDEHAVLPELAE